MDRLLTMDAEALATRMQAEFWADHETGGPMP